MCKLSQQISLVAISPIQSLEEVIIVIKFIYKRIIFIKMTKQIRTIGFRNAIFVGETDQADRPHGIGLAFDDMFLACLANWQVDPLDQSNQVKPSGPTLLLYPHRQIFYSSHFPSTKKLEGFWCYETPEYKIIGKGQNPNLAIIHIKSRIVSQVQLKDNKLEHRADVEYKDEEDMWIKIEQTTAQKIERSNQSVQNFIEHNFVNIMNKQHNEENFVTIRKKRQQVLYGILTNNEGSAFGLKRDGRKIETVSIGYYKVFNPSKLISYGRKYIDEINSTSYKVQQGNFETGQTFYFEFSEKRPAQSYKNSRKCFRQNTNFRNQFLHFSEADDIYKRLSLVERQYVHQIGSKYGQRIIQGQKQKIEDEHIQRKQENSRAQRYKEVVHINREYNLEEAKAKIQQEINKRKIIGSAQRTGTFYVNSEKKSYPDTKSNTSYKYKHENSSPIIKYNIESEQPTQRYQRSPTKNTPKKFTYTDDNINEPIVSDWRKQSIKNLKIEHSYQSPKHNVTHQFSKPEQKINTFTLYPVVSKEPQTYRYRNDYAQKPIKQRDYDMRHTFDNIDVKIQREMEEKLQKRIQLEKQAERIRMEEYYRPVLANLNNIYPAQQVYREQILRTQPAEYRFGVGVNATSFSSRQPEIKRKHYFNYKYTEEQNNYKSPSPFLKSPVQSRNPQQKASHSPAYRLNTDTNPRNRQISRSPNVTNRNTNTGRKIYSYVD